MTLVDAGPLVALLDRGEPDHARCRGALAGLRAPLVTTWPAFTEAMHLLGAAGGWPAQGALWRLVQRGDLAVTMPQAVRRIPVLMEKYQDAPMDLADASLVALAEERRAAFIFTLDRHFRTYRAAPGKAFTVVP